MINDNSPHRTSMECAFKHNSRLMKNAPIHSEIDTAKLPDEAFPIHCGEIGKEYPHHFINDNNVMFLHKDLLINSYIKAIEKKAPDAILQHLLNHLQVIGLSKQIEEMVNLSDTVENLNVIKEVTSSVTEELVNYFKTVKTVGQLQSGIDEKRKILKNYINDASIRINNIFKPMIQKNEE
jgi:hypothetical protein